ncbi:MULTISPECIES: helix-turn-helix transcriptional regulator [unclassified Saccharopolyspora]|uniref:helix-turn-helix domain-containing protein n=1 Tax=unclassified Saccharopolyspora TaxID=2646250 RepID=UPI001CD5A372|nr:MULTISPECIES: helix-turn-helix transcriptional regulator [unclassified Saccharopolyspora]MCA1185997.1 helix-turn-helix transcriptional regulator [Saccharopolyspora sp. 6T]MCA1192380.1 helix-turn-helix transcriptional regulator [Saccharopolyspora sp. 6V]MCA1227966.1 helix-turn-helix transcriptional regulator [Saccharopolyspora sp. 6M]MCA1282521.1 helix-turn-helix transcriptional regulator [Saccharopolyspora sp. 7B]
MTATPPRPRAYVLGAELRDARRKSGHTLRGLASILDVSHSVLVRWEHGDRVPSAESISAVCVVLGVSSTARSRMLKLAREAAAEPAPSQTPGAAGGVDQLATLLEFERTATKITDVAPLLMPGLLQSAEYTRAIMATGVPEQEANKRVAMRQGRRDTITRKRSPAKYTALILESVLHQPIGRTGGLHDQLRFLDEISERDNVELRIIPSAAGWTPAHAGPFVLLEFAKADPVVHLEHHRSSAFLQDDDSVGAFRAARDELERIALSREDSRKLIAEIAAREQVPA